MLDQDEVSIVAEAMKKHGGGFVKMLGELLSHADHVNQRKIKGAWPKYWGDYLAVGLKKDEGDQCPQ